jgi:hypothetical protein
MESLSIAKYDFEKLIPNVNPIQEIILNEINSNEENFHLLDLLSKSHDLKNKNEFIKALKEYQMLLYTFQQTLEEFKNDNLKKFDPIVGENACQIRAVKIALIKSHQNNNFEIIQNKVNNNLSIINQILQNIDTLNLSDYSLRNFIKNEKLEILLNEDELFLFCSYLLTIAKISEPSEDMFFLQFKMFASSNEENISFKDFKRNRVYPKNLKKLGDVSSNFAEDLVRKTRKILSKLSVEFIKETSNKSIEKGLKKFINDDYVTRHLNCYCLPMFWTYKNLFSIMEEKKIPIIIHSKFLKENINGFEVYDEEYLLFEFCSTENKHIYKLNAQIKYKTAFIVQGVVYNNSDANILKNNWKNNFLNFSIKDLILAGAADHRQYPSLENSNNYDFNDLEYLHYKTLAKKHGFSIDNPSTFFIQHVYTSKINQII